MDLHLVPKIRYVDGPSLSSEN